MMNVAVIGVGVMGFNHVRMLSSLKNVRLAAISDVNREKLDDVAETFNVPSRYISHKEMLEKENLDCVVVAVPSVYHKDVVLDCFEKDMPVLVEKPIAQDLKEAREMVNAAKKKNLLFTVGHIERFNPAVMKIKEFLDDNFLGDLYLVNTIRNGPFPKRLFGKVEGVLIDLAVHDIDVVSYLVGPISEVYSNLIYSGKQEIYAKALLKTKNKVDGSCEFSWISPERARMIEIYGVKGVLKGDYQHQEVWYYENGEDFTEYNPKDYFQVIMRGGVREGKIIKYPLKKDEPLKIELEHFIDCVKNKKRPLVSPQEALDALKVAIAMVKSAEQRKLIKVK